MIFVYTGPGKGKTSACLGQVVRALGSGWKVAFAQFMKRDGEAGEQAFLRACLGDAFLAGGIGFFRNERERPAHRKAAEQTLAWAHSRLPEADVLILDESLYALGNGLVTLNEVKVLIEEARARNTHLILSGRGFPDELLDVVDLVTEMKEIKHPLQQGLGAIRGLDY
ncbi:MAG: cob(I)yrinic acid a,c-diamide adenosyltransferase [Desulfovibrionaceae bacterium]|nr:cob(I)yrinic acid a,c-diamide adenosyltransferase [Desulfovibrionaceae bacterium]